jgi:hypothetical protein
MKTTTKKPKGHKRYFVEGRMFAVVRSDNHQLKQIQKMSQGEIAFAVIKSKPPRMGRIIDAGRDGLSFSYIEDGNTLPHISEMDILLAEKDFHLSRLPFEPIEDTTMSQPKVFSNHSMKRMSVQFGKLSPHQMRQIDHMLKNYTTGEVPDAHRHTSVG